MAPVPDYVVIGHVTQDLQADGTLLPGGTALYGALAATRLGCRVAVVTAGPVAEVLAELLPAAFVHCQPGSPASTFVNRYLAGRRTQHLLGRAPTIDLGAMPVAWWQAPVIHLGPLTREIEPSQLAGRAPRLLGATPQGWLRQWDRDGLVRLEPLANPAAFASVPLRVLVVSQGNEERCAGPLIDQVLGRGGLVVVTRGAAGARLRDCETTIDIDAFVVDEVDPTGAGDVFAAALFVRLAAGDSPAQAARFASAAGALSVTGRGAASVPDTAAVTRLLAP